MGKKEIAVGRVTNLDKHNFLRRNENEKNNVSIK
jgi:hypothetical protein